MTTITAGNSATITLNPGDTVAVSSPPNAEGTITVTRAGLSNSGAVVTTTPTPSHFGPPALAKTFGPFPLGGTVLIACTIGTVDYSVNAALSLGAATENPTQITATRALTAADFGQGVITINAAGVVAITVPTLAAMGLSSLPGKTRYIAFRVLGGGIPTFAGATSSSTINGTVGPTTVTPVGGAPVTYDIVMLEQTAPNSDTWALLS